MTLAEVMQGAGYATVGFANNINVAPLFGFQQGFDQYVFLEPEFFFGATESAAQLTIYNQLRLIRERFLSKKKWVENYYQPADVVVKHGTDWLAARDAKRPFFMFLHFMEPHDPYFVHPYNGEAYARVANPNPDPALADKYREVYDGAIRFLDEELAKLVADLKAKGLYDDALIVLTADHGEEFHEHGGWWHGTTLYDEQIAVPLIVKPPRGGATGVVADAMVSSIDIAPTIIQRRRRGGPPDDGRQSARARRRRAGAARPLVRGKRARGQQPAGLPERRDEGDPRQPGEPARPPRAPTLRRRQRPEGAEGPDRHADRGRQQAHRRHGRRAEPRRVDRRRVDGHLDRRRQRRAPAGARIRALTVP